MVLRWCWTDFNPRTPCGVRPGPQTAGDAAPPISIHAPRVGCDACRASARVVVSNFNPRTPCGVRHPLAGAVKGQHGDFNPRTPCGVRLPGPGGGQSGQKISIHAPRVGCDWRSSTAAAMVHYFNPRTPCGVRPHLPKDLLGQQSISIHAPRVGCDDGFYQVVRYTDDFNPRTPCGVRLGTYRANSHNHAGFQSTHPVWGATPPWQSAPHHPGHFNPRTPCGVRPLAKVVFGVGHKISIHAPRVGCDLHSMSV